MGGGQRRRQAPRISPGTRRAAITEWDSPKTRPRQLRETKVYTEPPEPVFVGPALRLHHRVIGFDIPTPAGANELGRQPTNREGLLRRVEAYHVTILPGAHPEARCSGSDPLTRDQQLLRLAKQGEPQALEQLMTRYLPAPTLVVRSSSALRASSRTPTWAGDSAPRDLRFRSDRGSRPGGFQAYVRQAVLNRIRMRCVGRRDDPVRRKYRSPCPLRSPVSLETPWCRVSSVRRGLARSTRGPTVAPLRIGSISNTGDAARPGRASRDAAECIRGRSPASPSVDMSADRDPRSTAALDHRRVRCTGSCRARYRGPETEAARVAAHARGHRFPSRVATTSRIPGMPDRWGTYCCSTDGASLSRGLSRLGSPQREVALKLIRKDAEGASLLDEGRAAARVGIHTCPVHVIDAAKVSSECGWSWVAARLSSRGASTRAARLLR